MYSTASRVANLFRDDGDLRVGSVGVLDNGQQVAALGAELGFTPVDDTENADVCIADVLNILSVLVVGNNEGVGQRILGSEGVDRGCGRIVTDVQCGQGGRLDGGKVLSEVLGEDFTIQGGNGEVFVDRERSWCWGGRPVPRSQRRLRRQAGARWSRSR